MRVELVPHTGIHLARRVQVDLKQDRILLDGRVVGYVARKPDAPINLIERDLPWKATEAIRKAVQGRYGGSAVRVAVPPDVSTVEDDLALEESM